MANLTNNSLFLASVLVCVLGLLLLSHPFLTLTAITLCAVCHTLLYNMPSVVRVQSYIFSKVWGDANDHTVAYAAGVFDAGDVPSPILHFPLAQDIRNRRNHSDEIVSSTPQSSPNCFSVDNPVVLRSSTPPPTLEGRQLSFNRIAPKPTRLLTQEGYKSSLDSSGNSKLRSCAGGVKTIQTVAGPLIASTRCNNSFDAGMYVNVNSPGFTERLVRCANDNVGYNWSPAHQETHQDRYNSVGLFPIVHLNAAPAPSLSVRNSAKVPRSSVRVRIAPPIYTDHSKHYNGFGSNSPVGNIPRVQEPVRQDEMAKSVLESLQEASRKRIYSQCQEAMEDDPTKKRQRKGESNYPNPNCDIYQYRHIFRATAGQTNTGPNQHVDILTQGKRGRDGGSPGQGDSKRHRQSSKPCTSRNEISSSLSSSQKLLQCLSGSKRKAESDLSRPGTPHGKHFKDDVAQEPRSLDPTSCCSLYPDDVVGHLKVKPQPYFTDRESVTNQYLPRPVQSKQIVPCSKETSCKVGNKTTSSQGKDLNGTSKRRDISATGDISSKLFRKEISSRPVCQPTESSKRGRSWIQEPPDADERCLAEQNKSSELDRPERFQSLLSRMSKQGACDIQRREEHTFPSVLGSAQSTELLSPPLSLGNENKLPSPGSLAVPLLTNVVDGVGKAALPEVRSVLGRDDTSCQPQISVIPSASTSDAQSSAVTVTQTVTCSSEHLKATTSSVVQSNDHTSGPPASSPLIPITDVLLFKSNDIISSPNSISSQRNSSESSGTTHVSKCVGKTLADKSFDPSAVKPVPSPKPTIISTSNELPYLNPPSNTKPGITTASNYELCPSSRNVASVALENSSALPLTSVITSPATQTFSFSSSSHEKINRKPLFQSVASEHGVKVPNISSSHIAIPSSVTPPVSRGGDSVLKFGTISSKSESSSGVTAALAVSSRSSMGSLTSQTAVTFGATSSLPTSIPTFTFSSLPTKTISTGAENSSFQPSSHSITSSFSIPRSQGAFNSFGSAANSTTTSTGPFTSQQQSPSPIFSFGTSVNQTQPSITPSSQAANSSFVSSQPQGFGGSTNSSFSAPSEGPTFGNVSSEMFSPGNSVTFGNPNAFNAQSGSSSGNFGTTSPFGSSTVPSGSQNFGVSSAHTFSVGSAAFGSNSALSVGGPFQFGAGNEKSTTGAFNFGGSASNFNFGNNSSQAQGVNQPFQFGQSSSSTAVSPFQFGPIGSQPSSGGAPVFSIGAGPSSSHRPRPMREARRRR